MKSFKNNEQQGSAHVIIIAVIAVVVIGALGFLYWKNFMQPKQPNAQQEVSLTQTPESTETPEETTDEKPVDNNKLTLADWKVEFTIPDELKDTSIQYVARKTKDTSPVDYYAFTTARVKALGGECIKQTFGDIVMLYRYDKNPGATPDSTVVGDGPIDGYYYVLGSPIARCSGLDSKKNLKEPSPIETKDVAALSKMVKSLKSTK